MFNKITTSHNSEMSVQKLVLLCVGVALLCSAPAWLSRSGSPSANSGPSEQLELLISAGSNHNSNPSAMEMRATSEHWETLTQVVFPYVQHCGFDAGPRAHWIHQYAQRHAATVQAISRPSDMDQHRLLVSIPHLSGTADQIVSMVTQFYLAVLGNRTFTQFVPEGRAISLTAACDFPFFNWTHPVDLPDALLKPLPTEEAFQYSDPNSAVVYPGPYQNYAFHNMVNPVRKTLAMFSSVDLKDFPVNISDVPVVLSTSNRGLLYRMMTNPHHRVDWWSKYRLRPETAFMCGFWSLCSPNRAVQEYYAERFWKPMMQPDVLKIGIQVRLGDNVTFIKSAPWTDGRKLQAAAPYFACATLLERAFAKPGQKVLWYLLSDSALIRKTAKYMYPGKVLTDDEVPLVHVTCYRNQDQKLCEEQTLESAAQHALGEMLTFSLADYHITTLKSGFGRVGSWLSGKWDNKYELPMGVPNAAHICPQSPIPPEVSSTTFSGI